MVTLAGGAGSRWTQGAGVVKALHPFCKARRTAPHLHRSAPGQEPPRQPRVRHAAAACHHHQLSDARRRSPTCWRRPRNYGYPGPLLLSPGRTIGLRLVPMVRDLRFAWEEMPQQLLDEQAQKVRESLHAASSAGRSRPARAAITPTTCRRNACIRSAIGTNFRTCCATACWRACWMSARACATCCCTTSTRWARISHPDLLGLHIEPARR